MTRYRAHRRPYPSHSHFTSYVVLGVCVAVVLVALYHGATVRADWLTCGFVMLATMPVYLATVKRLSR